MAWIKVDVRAFTDPRLLSVGYAGKGLWLDGMCYAGMHQTDGHIPAAIVHDPKLADKLVTAGLWTKTDTGYDVIDFLNLNHTREQITQAKADKATRMAQLREDREACGTNVTSNRRVTNTLDRRSQIVDSRPQMVDGRPTGGSREGTDPEPSEAAAILAHLQRTMKAGV